MAGAAERQNDLEATLLGIAAFARSCAQTEIALSPDLLKLALANIAEHAELKAKGGAVVSLHRA